jgi:hypothetical protein
MELPIDTDKVRFVAASTPEALVRFDTFEEVTDGHGSTIYETDLVFSTDQTSRIFPTRTMTRPEGVTLGQAVQPVDLVISTWEIGEGFVLYAEALELVFEPGREASR